MLRSALDAPIAHRLYISCSNKAQNVGVESWSEANWMDLTLPLLEYRMHEMRNLNCSSFEAGAILALLVSAILYCYRWWNELAVVVRSISRVERMVGFDWGRFRADCE